MAADPKRVCAPYEGCRGFGDRVDETDSGSGWMVYCDCAAGQALKAADALHRRLVLKRAEVKRGR